MKRIGGRGLGYAIARWIEGLQNGEPVAYVLLGVVVLLAIFIGFVFLADRREDNAKAKKMKARAMKARTASPPANPSDPTRPRR